MLDILCLSHNEVLLINCSETDSNSNSDQKKYIYIGANGPNKSH